MMKLSRVIAMAICATVLGTVLTVGMPAPQARAANAASFDPGLLISDALFFDGNAMNADAVQNFLSSRVRSCQSGSTCLKDYIQDTPQKAAVSGRCGAYDGRAGESAAQIIARVGAACGISPKVLLVMLEKEQGLVSSTAPSASRFRIAMGYGCPDTAACDTTFYGFFNQVYQAAKQFKTYAVTPTIWGHVAGRVNQVRLHPNAQCGTTAVYIQNQATAGLYNYTPYQPNAAALGNLYGTGDACSSYGNRNFWRAYTDWFGSTTTSTLLRTAEDSSVFLVSGNYKYPVTSLSTLTALSPLGGVSFVSQSYLNGFPTLHPVTRAVRGSDGSIYFIASGIKLPFTSCSQALDYGASCAASGYVPFTDSQLAAFRTGPPLGPVVGTNDGLRFHVTGGQRREILDDQSQATAGLPATYNVLAPNDIGYLPLGAPITRDLVFARERESGLPWFIAGGQSYPINAADRSVLGVAPGLSGTLNAASLATIAAGQPFSGVVSEGTMAPKWILSGTSRYRLDTPGIAPSVTPVIVGPGFLAGFTDAGPISAGALIKSPVNATVYVAMPNDIRPVSSWDALLALSPTPTPTIITFPTVAIRSFPQGPVALKTGAMYRTPDDATVYVINGVTDKIAFSSFAFTTEAGFTEFAVTSPERMQGYPLASNLFTFGVSCDASKFVAAGGALHSVAPEKEALFPFTYVPLDPFTCRNMKVGVPASDFVRSGDGSIYQLVGGTKRPITSMARYGELSSGAAWLQVIDPFVAAIPTGPAA